MSLPSTIAGVGRTSIACQCISLRPGINLGPTTSMMRVSALRSTAIGSREMRSMMFPRINTFDGAESARDLPSKIRTLLNNVTAPLVAWALAERDGGQKYRLHASQNKNFLLGITNSIHRRCVFI